MTEKRKLLILGCGYLGKRVLTRALQQQWEVDTLTRNTETCTQLKQMGATRTVCADLSSNSWLSELFPKHYNAVIICVGSSESTKEGYHQSYIKGLESVSEWMSQWPAIPKAIYTSSISVYGSDEEDMLDERSETKPENWRGEYILKSEALFQEINAVNKTITRLGGIYGTDRNRFLKNKQVSEAEDYPLNLIHVDDAADAIIKLIEAPKSKSIYNLTDNSPKLRSEIDHAASIHFSGLEQPSTVTRKRRNKANRKICSSLIQKDLDWTPRYRDVIQAIRKMAC